GILYIESHVTHDSVYDLYQIFVFFFFQAEDGIRDRNVTGVQTCALPILGDAARRHGVPVTTGHAGSMWGMYFAPGPVRNFAEAKTADTALFARWHRAALARGVFLAPSAFEAGFVSSAHTDADIDATIAQLDAALGEARAR